MHVRLEFDMQVVDPAGLELEGALVGALRRVGGIKIDPDSVSVSFGEARTTASPEQAPSRWEPTKKHT